MIRARNILRPNNGILPGQQIRDLCLQLQMITPFSERVVEPVSGFSAGLSSASYDLTLRDALVLRPGDFSLAVAREALSIPDDICCMVHDKSSNARLGIVVQNTFVDPGFIGDLVLELTNHSCRKFYLHPGYPIAQLVFHWLAEPAERPYSGKYQGQRGIVDALRELKKDQ